MKVPPSFYPTVHPDLLKQSLVLFPSSAFLLCSFATKCWHLSRNINIGHNKLLSLSTHVFVFSDEDEDRLSEPFFMINVLKSTYSFISLFLH